MARVGFPEMHIWKNVLDYKKGQEHVDYIHIGEHYAKLWATLVENRHKFRHDLLSIKRDLRNEINARIQVLHPSTINIAFMCRHGKHRSVALCRLVLEVLKGFGFTNVHGPRYLSRGSWRRDQSVHGL